MKKVLSSFKLNKGHLIYGVIFIFWTLYTALFFLTPNTKAAKFSLNPDLIAFLRLSIALPYLVIWLASGVAFSKLRQYSRSLPEGSDEQVGFNDMSLGTGILGIGLICSTLAGAIKNYHPNQATVDMILTIISNYAYVLPYLAAFLYLYRGIKKIVGEDTSNPLKGTWVMFGLLFVFSYFWLDLIFSNATRTVSNQVGVMPTYYLNDSLIILTIVVPSFLAWSLGIMASVAFRNYYRGVKGTIYRSSLSYIVKGMIAAIVSSILLHAVLSLGITRLLALGIAPLLGIVYLFQIVLAIGFIFMAIGAHKLTRIETA